MILLLHHVIVGTTLLLVVLPKLVQGGCVFGADNIDQLVLRNNTIMGLMNDTLLNYTEYSHYEMAKVSNFTLWNYLQTTYTLSARNYLEFVSMGKLLAVNWTTATKAIKTNETALRTVAAYINTAFIDPLHNKLQEMAAYYSISFGIFRPTKTQFYFTGFTPASNSTAIVNATLDMSCFAGTRILWRVSTYQRYFNALNKENSTEYAIMATMVETAFDQYYRKHSALNKEFVRANVVYAYDSSNYLVMFLEAYFLNNSYGETNITSLTTLSGIPNMYYDDPSPSISGTAVTIRESYTYVANSSHPPPTTLTISTTTKTTTGLTTIPTTEVKTTLFTTLTASDTTSTVGVTSGAPSLSTATASIPLVPTSTSHSTTGQSSMSTNGVTTAEVTTLGTTNPTSTAFATTISQLPSMSTNNLQSSSALALNSSMLPTTAVSSTNLTNHVQATVSFQATTSQSIVSSPFLNTATLNSSQIYLTSSLPSISASSIPNSNGSTSQQPFQATVMNLANSFQANQSTTNGGAVPINPSTPITPSSQTGSTGTTGNKVGIKQGSIDGGGTFDPDPFFKANVPVITKVYNDAILLRKMGTMPPLTEKATFFSVTLPAAIGMLIAIIACMCCWQMDCLFRRGKASK